MDREESLVGADGPVPAPTQVQTAALVVPHPEKVTPNSKARIHRDFGYGGEDAYYCAWGPR